MSDHSADISNHIRGYMIVGAALLIGTILTVWFFFFFKL